MTLLDTLRGQIFRRTADSNFQAIGAEFDCISASGGWYVNRIGYGKLAAPAHVIWQTGAKPGDFAVAWLEGEDFTQPRRVAQFIIQARQYREGEIELSGPNYLGALNDFVAFERIGDESTVSSAIEGFRPHPSIALAPMAAYGPRYYTTHGAATNAGGSRFNVSAPVYARVGDTVVIDFSTADIARDLFVSEVTHVTDGRTAIEVADDLPYQLPANWPFTVYSKRINVANAASFVIGERVKIAPLSDGYNPLIIGTIADTEVVENNSDVIVLENYIPINVPIGYYAVSTAYTNQTDRDVEQLLDNATNGVWAVKRSPQPYAGTTFDPKGETVFQVLTSLSEKTGWLFRLSMNDVAWLPRNSIDYFPDGLPFPTHSASNLDRLGTDNTVAPNYGEIFELTSENAYGSVSHLVPLGGGSGDSRFTIADADIGGILRWFPELAWGSDGTNHYIFNRTLAQNAPRWKVETFPEIRPQNEASPTDRRAAANDLLWAACYWLRANSTQDVTYKVTCHTIADPWPGDQLLFLSYKNIELYDLVVPDLRITEVHHEVNDASGLRITRLTLNKFATERLTGEDVVARQLRGLQRQQMATNAPSTGAAQIDYTGATWFGDTALQSTGGDINLESVTGALDLTAAGAVTVNGAGMEVNTTISATGAIKTDIALVMRAPSTGRRYRFTTGTIRNIPRLFVAEGE